MTVPDSQAEVARFLSALSGGAPVETHISAVFVGTDTAWKLKKAVAFPFLDFTAPSRRKHFLQRELALNRVMAPEIYRDVAAIVRGADGNLCLAPAEAPGALDWVLRMAVIPPGDFLDGMARRGDITPALLTQVADMVVRLHETCEPVRAPDAAGRLRHVILDTLAAARAAGLAQGDIRTWEAGILSRLQEGSAWLDERAQAGFVRRAHGDLHLGNICLWRGAPLPFDALEFDEGLATIDVGYDLAFLLMDLDLRVGRAAANAVLNRYMARTGDVAQLRLYPLFLSLRAMIRAHIQAARGAADAARYGAAALAYLSPPAAPVIAIGGLQGTGKSTLARALAPGIGAAPGAVVLRSDELRKRLHGVLPETRLDADAYTPAANRVLNEALLAQAADAAASGHGIIIDASFLTAALREAVAAMAGNAGRAFLGLWLEAPLPVLEARLAARRGDASDADAAVLRAAAKIDPGPMTWHRLAAGDAGELCAAARRLLPTA